MAHHAPSGARPLVVRATRRYAHLDLPQRLLAPGKQAVITGLRERRPITAANQSKARSVAARMLLAVAAAVLGGCTYDFSLTPPPESSLSCDVPGLSVVLCDDFDRTLAFAAPLYESSTETPSIALEGKNRVLEIAPPDDRQEWLRSVDAQTTERVLLAFRMKVSTGPDSAYRILVPIKLLLDGGELHVYLRLKPGGRLTLVDEYQDAAERITSYEHILPDIGPGYRSFRLEIDVPAQHLSLELDGAEQMPRGELFPSLEQFSIPARAAVFVGAGYAPRPSTAEEASTAAVDVRLDDVVFAVH